MACVAVLIGVGVGVWLGVSGRVRDDRCRSYRAALTVAYRDPMSTVAPSNRLPASVAGQVVADRARFRSAVPVGANGPAAQMTGNWDGYVQQEIPRLLAERGC